jgi:hypothetical protein
LSPAQTVAQVGATTTDQGDLLDGADALRL